jgi:hypothetical protein
MARKSVIHPFTVRGALMNFLQLIELPPKEVTLIKLEFTPEEREIYKMVGIVDSPPSRILTVYCFKVEAKSQETFNRFRRAGTVLK